MKRLLQILFISLCAIPVFASCKVDNDMPCTADITNELNQTIRDRINPSPLENLQKPGTVTNNLPSPTNPFSVPAPSDYNSNCQFGFCPPQANPPVNNIIRGD